MVEASKALSPEKTPAKRPVLECPMSERRFTAVFERDEAGYIYAHVPELPEVQTQGRTLEQAREMVRAAIDQALELRRERREPIPAQGWAGTELVEVS